MNLAFFSYCLSCLTPKQVSIAKKVAFPTQMPPSACRTTSRSCSPVFFLESSLRKASSCQTLQTRNYTKDFLVFMALFLDLQNKTNVTVVILSSLSLFLKFIYFQRKGKGGRKRRKTSMCGCLSGSPYWRPGPQSRHVL